MRSRFQWPDDGREQTADVLVSHPHGAAFACGVASGLARAGRLGAFFSGVAAAEGSRGAGVATWLASRRPVLRNRILTGVPSERLHGLGAVELGARAGGSLLALLGAPVNEYDAIFSAHDAAVALLPWPKGLSTIYAYEDGALRSFRRAARAGLARVWDLPLPHYLTIEELWRDEAARWPGALLGPPAVEPAWKRRRKDAELALATVVSVASGFTKRSLERLDMAVPVIELPYGFPVDSFQQRERAPSGPFTVLAVGSHDLRKGTPYLMEAWRRAAIPDAELHLIGPMKLAKGFVDRYRDCFRHWPHLPKSELGARYAAADLLVFPTLGDGFGLVIQEAMCCGTPVVTTPCGGGPECITDGVDGWLVPARDIDALVDRLRQCAADRDQLFAVGKRARARAERWTWDDYGDKLARALTA